MRDIRFWYIPKVDLTKYSCLFRRVEPLGTKLKNMAHNRLGNILYLEIHKSNEVKKTLEFQLKIGGNAAFTRRIIGVKKRGVWLTIIKVHLLC